MPQHPLRRGLLHLATGRRRTAPCGSPRSAGDRCAPHRCPPTTPGSARTASPDRWEAAARARHGRPAAGPNPHQWQPIARHDARSPQPGRPRAAHVRRSAHPPRSPHSPPPPSARAARLPARHGGGSARRSPTADSPAPAARRWRPSRAGPDRARPASARCRRRPPAGSAPGPSRAGAPLRSRARRRARAAGP